ncbi:MAG: hypothetical protein ACW97A_12090 [Candidatus Thorarchaeota archaeon]|jgi:hypothetical protein
MSKTDIFSKYSQVYQKGLSREIVPGGTLVRQLIDVPTRGLDVGLFFKSNRVKESAQVYMGSPLPREVSLKEGFLEAESITYLSRTILSKFRNIDYLRVVISSGHLLHEKSERLRFLKSCQGIIDVLLRKARNAVHLGEFDAFKFDKRIRTLDTFLRKGLKMDDVSVEAASIPFNIAGPEYILLSGNQLIVLDDEPKVAHGIFYFVGGIGYTFDKKIGAVNEERLYRSTADLTPMGIDNAYVEGVISGITEDFQNNVHSLIFSDIWKKSKAKPEGVNFGGDILIKAEKSSDIWSGIFEVYIAPPKT